MKAKIKALRESRKMTQKDLAEMLGVAVQSVSKWELGKTPRRPLYFALWCSLPSSAT